MPVSGPSGTDDSSASPAHLNYAPRTQFAILVGTSAIQVVATAATLAYPVLLPAVPSARPIDLGIFIALVYIGAMLGATVSGTLVHRLGPVRSSQVGLLMQCLGLLLIAFDQVTLRLVGAVLIGLAYGPITPSSSQILARTTAPHRMGFVFSIKQTGVPLGGLLAGALLVPLASMTSWRVSLITLALAAILIALASNPLHTLLDRPGGTPASRTGPFSPIALILRDPGLRTIAIVSLLFAVCQLSLSGYLVVYLNEEVGLSLVDAGLVYALAQSGGIVGRIAWGRVADITGRPNAVLAAIALLLLAAALATALFSPTWPRLAIILVCVLFGATAIGWNGVFLALVARLAPTGSVAGITGGVLAFTYIGGVVGAPLFGLIGQSMGSLAGAYVGLAAVAGVTFLLLSRVRTR